ncbi:MAG: rod shape-determining protein MreC [Planctomycetota bacterium]
MPIGNRTVRLVVVLVVLAVLGGAAGIFAWAWSPLERVAAPWRAHIAGGLDEDADAELILRERLARLNARNVVLRRRLREYEDLSRRLGPGSAGAKIVAEKVLGRAQIIARSLRRNRCHVTIDAGVMDGVVAGLPVVVGESLVGVVAGEQAGTSLVQLVTDRHSRVPASLVLADEDGRPVGEVLGVCAGTGSRERMQLLFVEDREGLEVRPGLDVVTAPGRGQVPPGLVLGVVTSAAREPHSDHWSIELRPLRDPTRRATVLVLRGARILPPEAGTLGEPPAE